MDGVGSTSHVLGTPKKRKSKKKRKAQPDDVNELTNLLFLFLLFINWDNWLCGSEKFRFALIELRRGTVFMSCDGGGCLRSFHLTEEHGEGSRCPSLGLTSEEAKMIIDKKDFICKNCKYKQHQCSACGFVGIFRLVIRSKVFKCKDYACGHFYHPQCISELLHPYSKAGASLFEQHVAAGLKFLCHVHKCSVCHGEENKGDKNMQFAVCRLCPITYHRKCLPRFSLGRPNGYIFQRAWDGILHDQTLIYCMKHEIVKELGSTRRKHIIFPDAKNLLVPKGPESAPKEQDIFVEEELLDHPSSEPSLTPPPATVQNQYFCSNPMDSFAPSSLFTRPYPGSCGLLDDDD
ncbi:Protein ENHANCED DOWNY MILDEW 2 [Dichanthelium oligosanthes]|uniref:Protein ENHANCED DOWNY MILDEW 2 n=1 Tax=Dichanthelium oligosanthes TaxID=888268 RepID=A0A1E5WMY3_9POAL|nr:Protein ENHANCED DOWNY MILDEW 2 [Dichanthelium oligosanthes]